MNIYISYDVYIHAGCIYKCLCDIIWPRLMALDMCIEEEQYLSST